MYLSKTCGICLLIQMESELSISQKLEPSIFKKLEPSISKLEPSISEPLISELEESQVLTVPELSSWKTYDYDSIELSYEKSKFITSFKVPSLIKKSISPFSFAFSKSKKLIHIKVPQNLKISGTIKSNDATKNTENHKEGLERLIMDPESFKLVIKISKVINSQLKKNFGYCLGSVNIFDGNVLRYKDTKKEENDKKIEITVRPDTIYIGNTTSLNWIRIIN